VTQSIELIEFLRDELIELAPQREAEFARRADTAIDRLAKRQAQWLQQMQPLADLRYWVFHDAYQAFEAEYGLDHQGVIQANVNVSPSPKQIATLSRAIGETGGCVFREPQMDARWVDLVVGNSPVWVGVLDPLGSAYDVDTDLHINVISSLVTSFQECFSAIRP